MTRTVGLTGGIASGKSTVSDLFRQKGARIVDADIVAREVTRKGTQGYHGILDLFGPAVIDNNGQLNRKKLGAIVFGSPEKRKMLERLVHPLIAAESQKQLTELGKNIPFVFYDAALLIENNTHLSLWKTIVVAADKQTQQNRLRKRDGLTEKEVTQRIHAQMPLEQKCAVADFVIDNNGSLTHTQDQVHRIWQELTTMASADNAITQ